MKPFTQVYGFFDNVDVNRFCFPKLVEITMVDGVFEVGEGVWIDDTGLFSLKKWYQCLGSTRYCIQSCGPCSQIWSI